LLCPQCKEKKDRITSASADPYTPQQVFVHEQCDLCNGKSEYVRQNGKSPKFDGWIHLHRVITESENTELTLCPICAQKPIAPVELLSHLSTSALSSSSSTT
jgi:hypothetical protein